MRCTRTDARPKRPPPVPLGIEQNKLTRIRRVCLCVCVYVYNGVFLCVGGGEKLDGHKICCVCRRLDAPKAYACLMIRIECCFISGCLLISCFISFATDGDLFV